MDFVHAVWNHRDQLDHRKLYCRRRAGGGHGAAAVYSRSAERAASFARKHGAALTFTDLQAMAACPDIDAVYIASPNVYHASQSRLFLEHGKHVLCEKPITVTADQARELVELARSRRLVYMEAIMMLHQPARKTVLQALGSWDGSPPLGLISPNLVPGMRSCKREKCPTSLTLHWRQAA